MNIHNGISIGVIGYLEVNNFPKFFESFLENIRLFDQNIPLQIYFIFDELSLADQERLQLEINQAGFSDCKIICNPQRIGKINAINLFLKESKYDFCILSNMDVILGKDVLKNLTYALAENPEIGMIGPRIGPLESERIPSATLRRIINTLWDLHHQLSLIKPKISELIGFKKRFIDLPLVGLDDLIIEELVSKSGLKIQYLPSKYVYTRVPLGWKEYLSQRRRISAQYINYSLKRNYRASTRDLKTWYKFLLKHNLSLTKIVSIILLMFIEVYALILGLLDNFRGKDLLKWPAINTTKQ